MTQLNCAPSCLLVYALVGLFSFASFSPIIGHGQPHVIEETGERAEKFTICTLKQYREWIFVFSSSDDDLQQQQNAHWESVVRTEEQCISIVHTHEKAKDWYSRLFEFLDTQTKQIDEKLRGLLKQSSVAEIDGEDVRGVLTRNLFEEGLMEVANCSDTDTLGSRGTRESTGSIFTEDDDGNIISHQTFGCVIWNNEQLKEGNLVIDKINIDTAAIDHHCRSSNPPPQPYEELGPNECFLGILADTLTHEKLHIVWPAAVVENGKPRENIEEHEEVRNRAQEILNVLSGEGTPPPIWNVISKDPYDDFPKPIIYVKDIIIVNTPLP